MLRGFTVLESGGTVVAAASGAMFRRLGATVYVTGDELVAHADGRPGRATQRARLLAILGRDKERIDAEGPWDPAARRIGADITIVDVGGLWRRGRSLDGYEGMVSKCNRGSWVTVSPYGLWGRFREHRGTELTAAAAGGICHYMRTSRGRPMKPAGFTTSITTGHFAALAGLHGAIHQRQGLGPIHMDLSTQDAVIATGVFLECAHRLFDCAAEGGSARYASPRGFVRCGRGLLWILVIEDHHWIGCLKVLGQGAWAVDIHTLEDREARRDEIRARLETWAQAFTAEEAAERLQAAGVPATPVNTCADLLAGSGRYVRDGFFEQGDQPNELLPRPPFTVSRPADEERAPRRPRRRYRVVDAGSVLVVPLAAAWLGAMGIDVLKLEDPDRADIYRRHGPFLMNEPDPERSAYFASVNHSKRSHTIYPNTQAGRGQLADIIHSADVVMTNLSPHRAERLGLTRADLTARGGPVLVSCSGFGRDTSHASYRAYGMNIQAAGGVVHLTRDRDGAAQNLGTSWADPLTSIWLAVTTVAQLLQPPRERTHVDVSMTEVVAYELPEYFSALSADGIEVCADENRLDHASPHGIYSCAGTDRWIAIEVGDDEEWQRLVDSLGSPATLCRSEFESMPGRLVHQDTLDAALDHVLAGKDRDATFEALQKANVACAPVLGAAELTVHGHLRERGLFQEVDHPSWRRALVGLPWRVVGVGPVRITRPPLLGEHTVTEGNLAWQRWP